RFAESALVERAARERVVGELGLARALDELGHVARDRALDRAAEEPAEDARPRRDDDDREEALGDRGAGRLGRLRLGGLVVLLGRSGEERLQVRPVDDSEGALGGCLVVAAV